MSKPITRGRKFAPTQDPKIIPIDRSAKFNAAEFVRHSWSIIEEDERSLVLTELDITAVRLEHMLESGETYVKGETKLERLKAAGHVRLDARIFQTFWENQHLIPESWKENTNGNTMFISFDGTILLGPNGHHYVFYLYKLGDEWSRGVGWLGGRWSWGVDCLGDERSANNPSAVLAS